MHYMLLIYSIEGTDDSSAEEYRAGMKRTATQHRALMEETASLGILRGADPLEPTPSAKTVRTSGGHISVTDGPFAETKEQLAGYYLLDCADMNEAVEWAKKIPTNCLGGRGCVEIRPVRQIHAAEPAN